MVIALVLLLLPTAAHAWDRAKAFPYLEESQRRWAEWKYAQRTGGPCVSCHTGLPYSFARRAAGLRASTLESGIADGVRARLLASPAKSAMTDAGAESVLNVLALALHRVGPADPVTEADDAALRTLWERQIRDGAAKGAWTWFSLGLEPWDMDHSQYFGATLAARALAAYPAGAATGLGALREYLRRDADRQPLHNRLAWAAFDASEAEKPAVLQALWRVQSADGGWTTAALGPWRVSADAPPDRGSNAYATAWAAFTARESGVACTDPKLARALRWLERRQDKATGAWPSPSMNQVYPKDSIQVRFMTDAATGYAAAALASCGR